MSLQLSRFYQWMTEAEITLTVMLLGGWRGRQASSVMIRLQAISPDLALAVGNAQSSFAAVSLFRLEGTRAPGLVERAERDNDAVIALIAKHVSDSDLLQRAEEIFYSRNVAIREGPQLLEQAAADLSNDARRLAGNARARRANAPSEALKADIEDSIATALADVDRFVFASEERKAAVMSFLRHIFVADELTLPIMVDRLQPVVDTLGRSKAARRKWLEWVVAPDPQEFAAHFAPARNYVKGIVGEIWFRNAVHTEEIRGLLLERARLRAGTLSRGDLAFTAEQHLGPLFDRSGRQIFDGIYFFSREAEASPKIREIHLDSVIEVKTGDRPYYALQQRRDQLRELGVDDKGLEVRTADEQRFRIMPPPDAEDPVRVFVAPKPPQPQVLQMLEASGVHTVYVPTLPTREQFGMIADFFLLAMLSKY